MTSSRRLTVLVCTIGSAGAVVLAVAAGVAITRHRPVSPAVAVVALATLLTDATCVDLRVGHHVESYTWSELIVVVGLALAARLSAAGDTAGAADVLGFVPLLETYRPDEWALVRAASDLLATGGKPSAAVETLKNLFHVPSVPRELRAAWLPPAIEYATLAKNPAQAEAWRRPLAEIPAPPPAKPPAK